jgi:hypothetical protein
MLPLEVTVDIVERGERARGRLLAWRPQSPAPPTDSDVRNHRIRHPPRVATPLDVSVMA